NKLKKELNEYVDDLHTTTTIGQSIFEMIEHYSNIESPSKVITFDREQVKDMDEMTFRRSKQTIEKLVVAGEACGDLASNPWTNIKQTVYSLKLHDTIKAGLTSIKSEVPRLK